MDLITVNDAYNRVKGNATTPLRSLVDAWIKRHNVKIVSEIKLSRGTTRLMTGDQLNEILAAQVAEERETLPPSDLRLGALETKIDRLNDRLLGVEQASSTLIKAANLNCDVQTKLLDEVRGLVAQLK